jgi:hypothetical protein
VGLRFNNSTLVLYRIFFDGEAQQQRCFQLSRRVVHGTLWNKKFISRDMLAHGYNLSGKKERRIALLHDPLPNRTETFHPHPLADLIVVDLPRRTHLRHFVTSLRIEKVREFDQSLMENRESSSFRRISGKASHLDSILVKARHFPVPW